MISGVKKRRKNVAFRGERFRRPRNELVIVVFFMKWAEGWLCVSTKNL
jgi:hypothetical protein